MELELRNHRLETVKEIILRVFAFLERQYHYVPTFKVGSNSTFDESLEVEYTNEIKRRKIRISYTKSNVFNEIKYTFNSSMTRIPYSGVEDYFSLANYLQSINKDFSTSIVNDFTTIDAEQILTQIAASLQVHVLKMIAGEQWLEAYYPRKD